MLHNHIFNFIINLPFLPYPLPYHSPVSKLTVYFDPTNISDGFVTSISHINLSMVETWSARLASSVHAGPFGMMRQFPFSKTCAPSNFSPLNFFKLSYFSYSKLNQTKKNTVIWRTIPIGEMSLVKKVFRLNRLIIICKRCQEPQHNSLFSFHLCLIPMLPCNSFNKNSMHTLLKTE
jgi:hypothetical protein